MTPEMLTLEAVAVVLNNQLRDRRAAACIAINRELEVRGIRLALFDHAGIVAVGTMPPSEPKEWAVDKWIARP